MADNYSFPAEHYVLIGKVGKAHGIGGELKLIAFSGEATSITRHRELTLVSSRGQLLPVFTVVSTRPGNKAVLTRLDGVTDRDQAEKLHGYGLLVKKDALPPLSGDHFYLHELEGIRVRTTDGRELGKVEAFFDNGVQDVLVVRGKGDEFYIPLIPGMIAARDNEWLTIAPPQGLLEINSGGDDEGSTSP